MIKVISELFVYEDNMKRLGECWCDVLIDETFADVWLVVFTELNANMGPSVTNAAEFVIQQFCKIYGIGPFGVTFFERYQTRPTDLDMIHYDRFPSEPRFGVRWSRLSITEAKPILEALK